MRARICVRIFVRVPVCLGVGARIRFRRCRRAETPSVSVAGGAGGFLAQYPQLCVSLAESPEDDQRPALLGPLLQLDRLSLDDEAQAGSSGESCYSSPEDCSTTATLPVGADRPRPPLCEIEKMPS
uniref:Secreted protein n=1 Tax=Plectus sambesii TaxID=2011161 RepID=A0A914VR66_9BILA